MIMAVLFTYHVDNGGCYADDDSSGSMLGKPGNFKMIETKHSPPTKKSRRDNNSEKYPPAASLKEVIMEQRIWKEFPEDLFEAVIARLPVATFFHFRLVCRKWNSLLNSQSFSQCCAEVSCSQPWFYGITREDVNTAAVYDPSLRKWHHLSVPTLPGKIIPVTSAGGLVCYSDTDYWNFYVSNPLTHSFKKLPRRSVHPWPRVVVGMSLNGNSASNGYKIMWLGGNGDYEVYDSQQDSWNPGTIPSTISLPFFLNFRSEAVSVGHTLYFMRAAPDGIVSYDMVSGVWKQFSIPSPLYLTDHTLAECGGRIMLVGLLTKNAATCICIWELQKMTLLWKEVDRMPNMWCLEFYGKHVWMTCLGNRGLFMLSLRSRQMNRLVTYDAFSKEWRKVPGCVLPHRRKKQWIAHGTSFYPCPTAIA
ncbi:hypothetical protein Taro_022781 [Colocasia esculenta]|uniref:F-box domain-containing protein n=1 Tax=Colocasia esculenta TaxID=4460 RepID=A0A843V9E1_COLES|nr:hypothetical protein [Colocasia esculenta]